MRTVLIKIAWRNLKEHPAKTWIVGLLLAVGMLVLVVGNSLMDSATEGIERAYIQNYTGHLMLSGTSPGRMTIFGYQDAMAMEEDIPVLPDFDNLYQFVQDLPYVESVTPQASGYAIASAQEEAQTFLLMFGIEPNSYQATFPDNVELHQGRFLEPGEEGIMLTTFAWDTLNEQLDDPLQVGDPLIVTGMSAGAGMRIREIPIVGLFDFKQSNVQLDMVSLVDINTLRALTGMALTRVDAAELSPEQQRLVGGISEEDLFGGSDFLIDMTVEGEAAPQDFLSIFEPGSTTGPLEWEDTSAWHFLLVRLNDERNLSQAMADIQTYVTDNELPISMGNWLSAAGAIAEMSFGVRWVFNAIVIIIAVVAVIIIMNTLVISVTQRMAEFGTMRAIGAQKSFIRRMILWETILVSGIFGTAGTVIGAIVLRILQSVGIQAPNVFFEIIFGGPVLHPSLSWSAVFVSLGLVLFVALAASLYPTSVVLRTQPVKAIQSE